jgi:hypothetical protein
MEKDSPAITTVLLLQAHELVGIYLNDLDRGYVLCKSNSCSLLLLIDCSATRRAALAAGLTADELGYEPDTGAQVCS